MSQRKSLAQNADRRNVSPNRSFLALGGFALVSLFGIFARPLLPVDETRYLAVAWEMRVTANWLVPHLNGAIYTDKPPLLFWAINLVWAVFGVSEMAARLVGPAFGLAAIAATGALARRLWPEDVEVGGRRRWSWRASASSPPTAGSRCSTPC